jgi:cytochrome c-type biogenesis protein CcmH/NrfF
MQFSFITRARLIIGIFAGVLLLLGAGDDAARVDRIGHQMMCVCGCNQILLECNHVGCSYSTRMRDELTAAVTRGDSDNSVLQWFIQTYGTIVLAVPTNTGFNRIAWVMPYLGLVVGIGAVVLITNTWRKRPPGPPTGTRGSGSSANLDHFRQQARRETEL